MYLIRIRLDLTSATTDIQQIDYQGEIYHLYQQIKLKHTDNDSDDDDDDTDDSVTLIVKRLLSVLSLQIEPHLMELIELISHLTNSRLNNPSVLSLAAGLLSEARRFEQQVEQELETDSALLTCCSKRWEIVESIDDLQSNSSSIVYLLVFIVLAVMMIYYLQTRVFVHKRRGASLFVNASQRRYRGIKL